MNYHAGRGVFAEKLQRNILQRMLIFTRPPLISEPIRAKRRGVRYGARPPCTLDSGGAREPLFYRPPSFTFTRQCLPFSAPSSRGGRRETRLTRFKGFIPLCAGSPSILVLPFPKIYASPTRPHAPQERGQLTAPRGQWRRPQAAGDLYCGVECACVFDHGGSRERGGLEPRHHSAAKRCPFAEHIACSPKNNC